MSQILGGNCEEWPTEPGEWQIRVIGHSDAPAGPQLLYGCPNKRGSCGVPIQPSPPNHSGCSWHWDGNANEPTLTPSINCVSHDKDGKPTGGCGWHGFMTKGQLR